MAHLTDISTFSSFSISKCLKIILIFPFTLTIFYLEAEATPNGRIITIPQGRIKGRYSETRAGRFFTEYFGIPYAQTPKRFKTARWPLPTWDGTRDASFRHPPCFQIRGTTPIGDEDCLTLNVHTVHTHDNHKLLKDLPVLVVFHGGSWMVDRGDWSGGESDQFGAKHFMDEDCVIVTVNYRLGVLGFFSLFNEEGAANLGLKDQVVALRWVKDNIVYFGGNASQVTIVGQGAGAASVGLHLLSPMSKGLFSRAIMQSGSPLCHWALVDDRQLSGLTNFLNEVGCEASATKAAQDCLEEKAAEDLENARIKIMTIFGDPFYPFGPVIEHWVRSNPKMRVFLPDYPLNILMDSGENATWTDIPIMMGVNSQDGLNFITGHYIYNPESKDQYFANHTKSYPPNFGFGMSTERFASEDELNTISDKIREFYYKDVPGEEMKNRAHHQTHIDMFSHRNYYQCVKNAAVLYGAKSDIFLYYWSRVGSSFKKWHNYDKLNLTEGVANGDEVHFLFDPADDYGDFFLIRESRPKNLKFSENVVKLWIMFAANGKPVDDWQSMKGQGKGSLQWYQLGPERMMIKEPFTTFTDFWDSLGLDGKRELPPAGEKKKKLLGRKEKPEDDGAGGDDGGGAFVYVDLDSTENK